jgi:MFS family permease
MGVYSTSQFLGVAIGGSLGGWVVEMFDGQAVFLAGALLAAVWLLVASNERAAVRQQPAGGNPT